MKKWKEKKTEKQFYRGMKGKLFFKLREWLWECRFNKTMSKLMRKGRKKERERQREEKDKGKRKKKKESEGETEKERKREKAKGHR